MPGRPKLLSLILLAIVAVSTPAEAADFWQEAGAGAVAILPDPSPTLGIASATLYCSEQAWGFHFRTDPARPAGAGLLGTITVGWEEVPLSFVAQAGNFHTTIQADLLERLKSGNSLRVVMGEGAERYAATFNLRQSRRVIEAISPRCSQIDMEGFEPVVFNDMGVDVAEAEPLVAAEVAKFREFTGASPKIAATSLDIEGGHRLLFATVCGSTGYYGPSGCNLSGYSRMAGAEGWTEAYNTEGMHLYLDRNADNGGFPNLATLEVFGGTQPIHWIWGGDRYMLRDQIIGEGDEDGDTTGDVGDTPLRQ